MSKKKIRGELAKHIGMRVAHEIILKLTNRPESIEGLKKEMKLYDDLSVDTIEKGNWNLNDLEEIKELALKSCWRKLERYVDISDEKFDLMDEVIEGVMEEMGLVEERD